MAEQRGSDVALVIAVGVATIGMIVADVMGGNPLGWSGPGSLAVGRAAVCFVVFGGVVLAVLSGGSRPLRGAEMVAARLGALVRAGALFVLGGVLVTVSDSPSVILESFAVLVAVGVLVLGWRARWLFVAAVVTAVAGPLLVWWWQPEMPRRYADYLDGWVASDRSGSGFVAEMAFDGVYPVLVWVPFLLLGVAIGRLDSEEVRVRVGLVVGGLVAAVVGYFAVWSMEGDSAGFGWTAYTPLEEGASTGATYIDLPPDSDFYTMWSLSTGPTGPAYDPLLAASAQSVVTPLQILGSAGVAALLLGLILLIPTTLHRRLAPLSAVGRMPITLYTLSVLALTGLNLETLDRAAVLITLLTLTLIVAYFWNRFLGRAPLEWATDRLADRLTSMS
ncbi:DUF418 domain-containing protein [Nocardia puris]|uniref:Uncharacterized protein DUF418 n=1 Tax=Nocardia puris TaxID=208602 RepID=A0A366DNW2_9NOCA|nr:DUF418 domain-containing protein [Nocardia puris]RBO91783.1 uncharacterized protein DUF418 [Nocardia puris]